MLLIIKTRQFFFFQIYMKFRKEPYTKTDFIVISFRKVINNLYIQDFKNLVI